MNCRRCKGLMSFEELQDLQDGIRHVSALRCIVCGDIVDPVIMSNRKRAISELVRPLGGRARLGMIRVIRIG